MQKKNNILFDASALLTLIQQEKGAEVIEELASNAYISSVNLSETIAVLARTGMPNQEVLETISSSINNFIPFSNKEAEIAGLFITKSKSLGLSFGDRACIATGIYHNMDIYTADKAWAKLNLLNVKILLIR